MKSSRYSQTAINKSKIYDLGTDSKDYPGFSFITNKVSMIYEENMSESELEPQSLNVINQIEYVDFTLKNTSNKYRTYKDLNVVSLKHLLSVCVDAAIAGGVQLQSVRRNFDLKNIWGFKTADTLTDNPVIVGRTLSHQAMSYTLSHSFPNIKLVSRKYYGFEKESYEKGLQIDHPPDDVLVPLKNILVWIDPLDAEREYNNNFLEYVTTMVCVAVEGKPIIGVIHQPFENFTKWGWVGKNISNYPYPVASEPSDVSKPLTVIIDTAQRTYMRTKTRPAIGHHFNMIGANGAGYKSIQVTEGKADAYLHMNNIKKWKTCAGNALIKALNGSMTTMTRDSIDYGDPSDWNNSGGIIATILKESNFFPQRKRKLSDSSSTSM
ncbi:inositol monophosphatase 3 [Nephila pilipes]|uniref:inositol-phosphate phosphatase n=1 Tax=Nephila pilipes TaxID=299642 RepID=A0A8X6I886_NEPPI|nr:inositol monophosphatase 3 [Nephila pilipes]